MKIESSVLERLTNLVSRGPDIEKCGVLWSLDCEAVQEYSLHPVEGERRSFSFDMNWWLAELYRARENGWRFAGYFHSHPSGEELFPSAADQIGHPPDSKILLLGKNGETPRAFLLEGSGKAVRELNLIVMDKQQL